MNAAPPSPLSPVSERIAAVIFVLCQTLSMRLRAATVTQAQLTYIVGRLLGIQKRFRRLVERIRAGQPPRERTRQPRPVVLAPAPELSPGFPPPRGWRRWAVRPDKPVPLWRALRQTTFGWLLPLAPSVYGFPASAAAHREELLRLLAEPESEALLRASRRVGDSLRPLCWMLGIDCSVLYPARAAADAAAASPPTDVDVGGAAVASTECSRPAIGTGVAWAVSAGDTVDPAPRAGGVLRHENFSRS